VKFIELAKVNKKSFSSRNQITSWVEEKYWLSSLLYCLVYLAIGWSTGSQTPILINGFQNAIASFNIAIADNLLVTTVRILSFLIIIGISLSLIHPISIITVVFEESINSDLKAFFSILFWSILLVFIFCYFDYFADILVVTSSTILFRLDLQKQKKTSWQVLSIIIILAFLSFLSGLFLFEYF